MAAHFDLRADAERDEDAVAVARDETQAPLDAGYSRARCSRW
jgi:hypothetical protein